jgi:hypothetical protein
MESLHESETETLTSGARDATSAATLEADPAHGTASAAAAEVERAGPAPASARSSSLRQRWPDAARWFAAQFLVVVAGVLVALAANDWAQRNREQRLAEDYAIRIIEDLDRVASSLEGIADWTRAVESAAGVLLPVLEGSSQLDDPLRLVAAAYQASRVRLPDLSPIVYRELLATGQIRLFRDATLRQALGHYFVDFERAEGFLQNVPRDFTRIARGALPPALQVGIHDRCDNTTADLSECMPEAGAKEALVGLERLRADPGAAPALRWLLVHLHALRVYAEQQQRDNRALRELLAASLPEGL